MRMALGRASACRRAARLGVSLLPGGAAADQVADDDQPGGDADPDLQRLARRCLQSADRRHDLQAGAHAALSFVLVRARIAEICEQPVAHELGDEAVVARDDIGAGRLVGADHVTHVFWIEPRRQCRRVGKIAEQQRKLPAFGYGLRR